jgi:RimJ/RimL family protein N-acetyltransferase
MADGRELLREIHSLLWADIIPENTVILKAIVKLGFQIEGTLRKERLLRGQRIDVIRLGLLKEEFKA